MIDIDYEVLKNTVRNTGTYFNEGKVVKVIGLTIEVEGITAFVGELCTIYNERDKAIKCEVVGFKDGFVILMPLGELIGISAGCRVVPENKPLSVRCGDELLGKILDGLGTPLDGEQIKFGEDYPWKMNLQIL